MNCLPCSRAEKSSKTVQVPTGEYPVPDGPWQVLAMDITGPFLGGSPPTREYCGTHGLFFKISTDVVYRKDNIRCDIIKWRKEIFAIWGNPLGNHHR